MQTRKKIKFINVECSMLLEDFKTVGLTSDNTGLQSEDKYLQSNKI